jgi:prepilin-type N-terminal cleavage/methylation domain-containing protein
MKNKGFTLLEMLTALIIMAIVAIITIPVVLNIITGMRKRAFLESEKGLIRAATNYLNFNEELYPTNIGDITEVSIDTLVTEEFVRELKNPVDGTMCSGYIMIKKIAEEEYEYFPEYKCGTSKTITSSTLDSLALNYNFDDFQEPTINLANYNSTVTNLAIGSSYNPTAYMTLKKEDTHEFTATYTTDTTYSSGIVGFMAANIPIATYTVSAETIDYYINPASTSIHGLGFSSSGSPAFTTIGYSSAQYVRTVATNFGVRIGTGTINSGSYIRWKNLQIEEKPYATPFVYGTRDGIVTDYSGNDNHSTLTMATTPRWINDSTRNNGTYLFNGTSTYINVGDGPEFNLTTTGTLSIWAKTSRNYPSDDVNYKYRGLISKTIHGGAGGQSYFIDWYGTNSNRILRAGIGDAVGINSITVNNFNFNNSWNHIVATWNGSVMKLYVNGVKVSEIPQTKTVITLAQNVEIGRTFNSVNGIWDGSIDNARIYERALTESEIATLYYIEGSR